VDKVVIHKLEIPTMKEQYIHKNFRSATLEIIAQANAIIEEYAEQGFSLTLRQLYYQFVARDLIPNTERSYHRLGGIINDGRLAGLIDWNSIEDRTRNLEKNLHLDNPRHAIQVIRDQYLIDMWANQPMRVEVWIEKEALAGVIADVCEELDVSYFACRGYVSQSEQWRAGMRHRTSYNRHCQDTVVLHFGDHDPSGMDMTRDNRDRLALLAGYRGAPTVERIALNMDQIEHYSPPPNPAKMTDSRFKEYAVKYGDQSWELDALEPRVIVALIKEHVAKYRDDELWDEREAQLAEDEAQLDDIITNLED
jgi:hypothetical protein